MNIEKFNEKSKVIARDNEYYLVTNDLNATLDTPLSYATVVRKDGTYITGSYPIDFFTRNEEAEWEEINGNYEQFIKNIKQNTIDGLIGFAIGDALGVPVEFLNRNQVRKINLKDMIGKDTKFPYRSRWGQIIPSGSWSDDTSMLIAGMSSIIDKNGKVDYNDIMNNYLDWWTKGKFTSLNQPFGLGGIVEKSLENYNNGINPLNCGGTGIRDNGNGSLMRILPFSLYCIKSEMSEEETFRFISSASSLTHGHDISKMSCFIYTEFLKIICMTKNAKLAFNHILNIDYTKYFSKEAILAHNQIITPRFYYIKDIEIEEKNGYVVNTLASVLYSILTTDNYEDAVLKSINMGYDTDTIGGITGSLAGMIYGKEDIPVRWVEKLRKKDYLIDLAKKYDLVLLNLKKKSNMKLK